MFDRTPRDIAMETNAILESPVFSLEDALQEAEQLIKSIRTHLQNVLTMVFRTELEFCVRQRLTDETVFSTTRTKEEAAALARSCWKYIDRETLRHHWNMSLAQNIPEYLSWWCMRIAVWSRTRTRAFKDQVVDEVAE